MFTSQHNMTAGQPQQPGFLLVKSYGAEEVFDYREAKCAERIVRLRIPTAVCSF